MATQLKETDKDGREILDSVVIRFAGDSGDGMQLTGTQFTQSTALMGNDLSTFPDFPAEIRAPVGTTYGVSAFQINFASHLIKTPGDAPDVLVAMNPAALKVHLKDLVPGGTIIINLGAFNDRNIEKAGYKVGEEVSIALDAAASEFYKDGLYDYTLFEGSNGKIRNSEDQVHYLKSLVEKYPIDSIEDGCDENDWEGWSMLTKEIGEKCQLVGDDLLVTNLKYLKKAIENKSANSILIKPNQIGTLTETINAIKLAQESGWTSIISHRSGETEDTTISDIAVGLNVGQIKTGSLSRSDRVAKYNQLLRIEEDLGDKASFPSR